MSFESKDKDTARKKGLAATAATAGSVALIATGAAPILGLIALGIGCLQFVLDKGQEEDWFSSKKIIVLLAAALIALIWFVVNEWSHAYPIMDLRLLRQRNFATSAFMTLNTNRLYFRIRLESTSLHSKLA